MDSISMTTVIGGLSVLSWTVLAAVASAFLITAWSRTKMSGFLWLFGAVAVWPTLTRMFSLLLSEIGPQLLGQAHMTARSLGSFYATVALIENLIGGVLLITAAVILEGEVRKRMPVQPMPGTFPGSYPGQQPPYTGFNSSIPR